MNARPHIPSQRLRDPSSLDWQGPLPRRLKQNLDGTLAPRARLRVLVTKPPFEIGKAAVLVARVHFSFSSLFIVTDARS